MAAPLTTPKAGSASDAVFRDIVRGLYEGRFVPGQRLAEPDLVHDYGVSRGSVREALKRLAADGLVNLHLHRGAHIRQLSRKETRDILALLEVLIGLSARLTADRIADRHVAALFSQRYQELMSYQERSDSFDFVRARNRFYRVMVDIPDNAELRRILPSLKVHLLRVQVRSHQLEPGIERFADYRRIGAAVLAADPGGADRAGRRHVRRIATALERLPERAFAAVGARE